MWLPKGGIESLEITIGALSSLANLSGKQRGVDKKSLEQVIQDLEDSLSSVKERDAFMTGVITTQR